MCGGGGKIGTYWKGEEFVGHPAWWAQSACFAAKASSNLACVSHVSQALKEDSCEISHVPQALKQDFCEKVLFSSCAWTGEGGSEIGSGKRT